MCKYRKNILDGELSEYMKRICLKISENANFEIETVETDKNHIHFMITYSPSVSVSAIVRKLKQETTYTIWKDFPNLHKVYWKEKTFCANSFQRLKTFGFSWQYYINDNLEAMAKQLYDFLQVIFKVIVDILQKGIHIRIAVIKYG